jgi:hypothetical protein
MAACGLCHPANSYGAEIIMEMLHRLFDNRRSSMWGYDAAEICLDQIIGSKVSQSYDRAGMRAERRNLAERWAGFWGSERASQAFK